jgi:uncharacterized membrane protein
MRFTLLECVLEVWTLFRILKSFFSRLIATLSSRFVNAKIGYFICIKFSVSRAYCLHTN